MTKKEQAQLDELREQVVIANNKTRVAKALRWTQPAGPDVPPPAEWGKPDTKGYHFNTSTNKVQPAASSSSSHYWGSHVLPTHGGASKGSWALYSTKLGALQALRHEVEQ